MNDLSEYANLINQQTQLNNSWSAEQAQKQMDFQERMSNTAHQREIADLKAAGLNPVLSAKLGGASTPSGAMGETDTSGVSAITDIAVNLAKAENAKSIAQMRQSSFIGNNYSRNPLLSLAQDVAEQLTGEDLATAIAHGINWLKDKTSGKDFHEYETNNYISKKSADTRDIRIVTNKNTGKKYQTGRIAGVPFGPIRVRK